MKKIMFFGLGMAALMVGCTSADKVSKNTINQEEVIGHRFSAPEDLSAETNKFEKVFIRAWMEGKNGIIVR